MTALVTILALCFCVAVSAVISALREYSLVKLEGMLRERGAEVIERYRRYADEEERSLLAALLLRGMAAVTATLAIGWRAELSHAEGMLDWVMTGALAYTLVFLLAIVLPGIYAAHFAERIVLVAMPVMAIVNRILWPLVFLVKIFEVLGKRILGAPEVSAEDELEDEILDGLATGERDRVVAREQSEMIKSIFSFNDTNVRDIMTPRTDVVMLPLDTAPKDAVKLAIDSGHSRLPVYGETRDQIVGILYVKDLLKAWVSGDTVGTLADNLRRPFFVPESRSIASVLAEMRQNRLYLAVILDEYGGCAGIVTIEDIVEEIIGDIRDEHGREPGEEWLVKKGEHVVECSGLAHIEDMEAALGVHLTGADTELDTVGGYVFSRLGVIPAPSSEHVIDNLRFTVLAADDRRINRLRVEVLADSLA